MTHNSRILGVDPGYGRIGIAVLEKTNYRDHLIHSECFETNPKLPHHKRLLEVAERVSLVIDEYQPRELALETLLFSKNQKTALAVAEARGAILVEASKKGLLVREFNPNQIKLAVTGYGKSDKKQIINMVERLVEIGKRKKYDDEYDAIAVALTCSAIKLSTDGYS
jgi:crossover junction endodeoxyribonuclease RuvC